EDVEATAEHLGEGLGLGADGVDEEADDELDADEADSDGEAGAEGAAPTLAKGEPEDEDDEGHEHVGAEREDVLEEGLQLVHERSRAAAREASSGAAKMAWAVDGSRRAVRAPTRARWASSRVGKARS